MDKRSLLFLVSLTVTIFLVNLFFTYQQQETNKKWTEQQQVKKAHKQKTVLASIEEHTASPKQLPLVEIYSDSQGTQFLTTGVTVNGNALVLSVEGLPNTVYAKVADSSNTTKMTQATKTSLDSPVRLYQTSDKPLQPVELPTLGIQDLQLIVPGTSSGQTSVYLGQYKDGHFVLPANELSNDSSVKSSLLPPTDALAVLKTDTGFVPVGVYQRGTDTFTSLEEIAATANLPTAQTTPAQQKVPTDLKEKFFVLENGYQQIVFSNHGGAIAEINLPFEDEQHPKSIVKEIEFDREMVADHPDNAHFPLHSYYTAGEQTSGPFEERTKLALGGYYPLLRRDLIGNNGKTVVHINPHYYSFNLVSEYPELAEMTYDVTYFDKTKIVFEASQSHRKITKTYSIAAASEGAPYVIDVTIFIEGDSRGIWLTTGIPEVELISGSPAPTLKYRLTRRDQSNVENIDLPKDTITVTSVRPDWVCNSNGFFGIISDPLTDIGSGYKALRISGQTVPSRLVMIDEHNDRFKAADLPGYAMLLPLPEKAGAHRFRIYSGPFADSVLSAVDKTYADASTDYNPDYVAAQSFHGWFTFISEPFAKFLFVLMKFFYYLTNSWAFSIILLTVALKIMLWPLNSWSNKSMLRMQEIAPDVTAIQEKYKKEPQKAQMAVMNLYKERGINPLSGCFPLLIQMPFLIGMFDLLKSTFELRGAGFIPGWIDNLTSPDVLFSWSTPIFFIGNQFHLLPVLLGAVMFIQQRMMSTAPKDPALMTDQQRQQRAMGTIMTVVFTVMFYHFPSGLNIYWLSSMLLGILQQWWTSKQLQKQKGKPIVLPAEQPQKRKA